MNTKITLHIKNLVIPRNPVFELVIPEFVLNEKTVIGLVGNNGAGKTTFLQAILQILKRKTGDIRVFGRDWTIGDISIKKRLGVFLDNSYLMDYLTGEEYFNFLRNVFRIETKEFKRILEWTTTIFPIETGKHKLIRESSTGNQVKIGLVGSLLHSPDLIIWDEPFTSLDPLSRNRLAELIIEFKTQFNSSFIISSHNIDELYNFSDAFLCLNNGVVVASDGKASITKTHINELLGFKAINRSN